METSFESNVHHLNVVVVNMYNLHDCELRIQGDFNFSLGRNSGEVINFACVDDQGKQNDFKTKKDLGFLKKKTNLG